MNGAPAFLVDTNVLIYAYDAADPAKRQRALDVLAALTTGRGALSVQVLGEFYTNVTYKPQVPLTAAEARDSSIRYCLSWPILALTERTFLDALVGVFMYQLSYWDALIWATARENDIPNVVTEDQEHARLIGEVRYLNPFSPAFEMSLLT
jgi:predicted nucleic acid-binding protein